MNEIVNKFLLAGDKFVPESHLRQSGFTYSACKARYIYQSELDKTCFQSDMAYGDFKDLSRRTASHKTLSVKAFNIAKSQNMVDINVDLVQWPLNFLIKNFW